MVKAVAASQSQARSEARLPMIVEVVGPTGVGKTTLSKALSQRDKRIQISGDLELRKVGHLTVFLSQLPFLLPVLLPRSQASRPFTWDEIKMLVYLQAWPGVLRRGASKPGEVVLLDQGPVFKLATLRAFGPETLDGQRFEEWWDKVFEQWACTLDLVVWLHAPVQTLVERINTRTKQHMIKGKAEIEAHEYLARYQAAYEYTLSKLAAQGRMQVLKMDTGRKNTDRVVEEVIQTLAP